MVTGLKRLRRGAVVLGATFVAGVVGYHCFGRTWLESIYMTVTTISTVGFGERSSLTPGEQLFVIALILVGISAAVYTLGGLFNMMAEGELDRALGIYHSTRGIERLHDHVIVCGFGRLGRLLAMELSNRQCALVVVDQDNTRASEAAGAHLAYTGDATEEEVLKKVGIERAKTLVTALPSDAANVFITLTSRNLNRTLQIIARGESPATERKLLQAGADRVVLPAAIGAQRIAAMITRPSTIEFMELVAGSSVMDVEMDEVVIPENGLLIGKTVRDTELRRRHGLLVVAVKRKHGEMVFNPDPDFSFAAGDTVIVMGSPTGIGQFRKEHIVS